MTQLGSLFTPELLRQRLPSPGGWRPFPPMADRAPWETAHPGTRQAMLSVADRFLAQPWPVLTATGFLRYRVDGNRAGFEAVYFARRNRVMAALLDACLRGPVSDRIAEITDGAWLLCEETGWCPPAHSPDPLPERDRPYVDLFAAETAALLGWIDLLTGDLLNEQVRRRLRAEVRQRVLAPFRARDDWRWFGATGANLNNWTTWICSNLLIASLLLDAEHEEIVTTARRTVEALDRYLASVPADGGCDEGIHYWWKAGGCLFECLQTLDSACGTVTDPDTGAGAFDMPQIKAMAAYPMMMHIDGDRHVNFADSRPRQAGLPHVLYQFARRCGNEQVARHARALRGEAAALLPMEMAPEGTIGRMLGALFDTDWAAEPPQPFPMPAQAWFPDTEVLVARERPGTADGLFLAAKGGHNDEQHNHNDVGGFTVALDGHPVLIDIGVGGYTRQTFSADRYQIWSMQSSWHNAPEVNGVAQRAGREFAATDVKGTLSDEAAELTMDLAPAYPPEAGLASWRRSLRLDRTRGMVIVDDAWEFTGDQGQAVLHLIAATEPRVTAGGQLTVPGAGRDLLISYPGDALTVTVEKRLIEEPQLQRTWGEAVWRVALAADGRQGASHLELSPVHDGSTVQRGQ